MINYFWLFLIIVLVTLQTVTKKSFNGKISGGAFTFSAASTFFALVFFLITLPERFVFSTEYLPYSLAFATTYSVCNIFTFLSLTAGPVSLTSLISSFSLLLPSVYGLAFLGENISAWIIIGLVLLMISLVFINLENKGEEKKITLKWIIYVLISFFTNGCCSILQKVQQLNCDGLYKNDFMIVALIISTVVMFIAAFITEKKSVFQFLKKGIIPYSVCGISNGAVNYLVIFLSLKMAASVMFPVISAGGIILTLLLSIFLYKEKLSNNQIIGIIFGTLAVVFLNL